MGYLGPRKRVSNPPWSRRAGNKRPRTNVVSGEPIYRRTNNIKLGAVTYPRGTDTVSTAPHAPLQTPIYTG